MCFKEGRAQVIKPSFLLTQFPRYIQTLSWAQAAWTPDNHGHSASFTSNTGPGLEQTDLETQGFKLRT